MKVLEREELLKRFLPISLLLLVVIIALIVMALRVSGMSWPRFCCILSWALLFLALQGLNPLLFHESFHLAAAARYLAPDRYRLAESEKAVYVKKAPRRAYFHILLWPIAFWIALGVSLSLVAGLPALFFAGVQMIPSGMDLVYAWVVFRNPQASHVTYDGHALILHMESANG